MARGKAIGPFDQWIGSRGIQGLKQLGDTCGIAFDMDVDFQWHPLDSQRLLLWASKVGKAEPFMEALNRRHFERRESASARGALLAAAAEAGLDLELVEDFLASDALTADVWQSYSETIDVHGIHSIPLFVFNGPDSNAGPFRKGEGVPQVVNGSASPAEFLQVFEEILSMAHNHHAPMSSQRRVIAMADESNSAL